VDDVHAPQQYFNPVGPATVCHARSGADSAPASQEPAHVLIAPDVHS